MTGGKGIILRPEGVDGYGVGDDPPPFAQCVRRRVLANLTIRQGVTCFAHEMEIAGGVDVQIDGEGELLLL